MKLNSAPRKIIFVALISGFAVSHFAFGRDGRLSSSPNVVFTTPVNLSNDASQAHYPWVISEPMCMLRGPKKRKECSSA